MVITQGRSCEGLKIRSFNLNMLANPSISPYLLDNYHSKGYHYYNVSSFFSWGWHAFRFNPLLSGHSGC